MMQETTRRTFLVATLLANLTSTVYAQTGRQITIVVPYAAGGAADAVLRPLAIKLQERLGRPVIVDNRAGANGLIGTQHVLRQPADGSTILFHITSLVQNVALSRAKPPYDFNKDLQPLVLLGRQPVVLVVPGTSPYRSFADLERAVKASPSSFAYGSYGAGSTSHIYGEALRAALEVDIPHAAFRGVAPLVQEMIGGRIPMGFVSATTAVDRDGDKTLRALAVASGRRMELLPHVPTLAELGYSGFEATGWWGLFLKGGTPASVSEPLLTAIRAILEEPEMRARARQAALEHSADSPEQIAAGMQKDYLHWEALSRRFNITTE